MTNNNELRDKIRDLYLKYLEREPSDSEIKHYLKQILDKKNEIKDLHLTFKNSEEHQLLVKRKNYQKKNITNKNWIIDFFKYYLNKMKITIVNILKTIKFQNKKTSVKIFWAKCNCECKEKFDIEYECLEYNSNVCSNCLGIRNKEKQNFGDMITSYIYAKIKNETAIWSDDKNSPEPIYFGSGSIMNLCKNWKNVIVWGTGIISEKDNFDKPRKIISVRGPLTRKRFLELGYECPENYGDLGLLLPKFYSPITEKKYKLGIIPHYIDYEYCVKKFSMLDDVLIINVCDDIENVIKDIVSCNVTISSSLHGIIVSHAYNIKSCWVKFSEYIVGGNTKYYDYYYSINLTDVKQPIIIDEKISSKTNIIDFLMEKIHDYPNPKFPINIEKLVNSCPFIDKDKLTF